MGGERESVIDDAPKSRKKPSGSPCSKEDAVVGGDDGSKGAVVGGPPGVATESGWGEAAQLVADFNAAMLANTDRPPGLGGQVIRLHENKKDGAFHFHVDAEGIKAVVPVTEMWVAWDRIKNLGKFTYVDADNKTILTVVVAVNAKGVVDAYTNVKPITTGSYYQRIAYSVTPPGA
jgi:hypothetical protein